jgi:hypothetical protein
VQWAVVVRSNFFESFSTGAVMAYNFTEKKRIRKSFAKRKPVLEIP